MPKSWPYGMPVRTSGPISSKDVRFIPPANPAPCAWAPFTGRARNGYCMPQRGLPQQMPDLMTTLFTGRSAWKITNEKFPLSIAGKQMPRHHSNTGNNRPVKNCISGMTAPQKNIPGNTLPGMPCLLIRNGAYFWCIISITSRFIF